MVRRAFTMKLKPGFETEYKLRHDKVWDELKMNFHNSGICEYSIFLNEATGVLFGYQKIDTNNCMNELNNNLIQKKWWDYMSDIMEVNPDNSPIVITLNEVFSLEDEIHNY